MPPDSDHSDVGTRVQARNYSLVQNPQSLLLHPCNDEQSPLPPLIRQHIGHVGFSPGSTSIQVLLFEHFVAVEGSSQGLSSVCCSDANLSSEKSQIKGSPTPRVKSSSEFRQICMHGGLCCIFWLHRNRRTTKRQMNDVQGNNALSAFPWHPSKICGALSYLR